MFAVVPNRDRPQVQRPRRLGHDVPVVVHGGSYHRRQLRRIRLGQHQRPRALAHALDVLIHAEHVDAAVGPAIRLEAFETGTRVMQHVGCGVQLDRTYRPAFRARSISRHDRWRESWSSPERCRTADVPPRLPSFPVPSHYSLSLESSPNRITRVPQWPSHSAPRRSPGWEEQCAEPAAPA